MIGFINIEIKAACANPDHIREVLKNENADFIGTDRQVDTYFRVETGRLKLREGNIENALIYYVRDDLSIPKKAAGSVVLTEKGSGLKELLARALGILTIVDKMREIYFIENVKFHIDVVKTLGSFVEIEAQDLKGTMNEETLLRQCKKYMTLFGIRDNDLVTSSYSDMMLK